MGHKSLSNEGFIPQMRGLSPQILTTIRHFAFVHCSQHMIIIGGAMVKHIGGVQIMVLWPCNRSLGALPK